MKFNSRRHFKVFVVPISSKSKVMYELTNKCLPSMTSMVMYNKYALRIDVLMLKVIKCPVVIEQINLNIAMSIKKKIKFIENSMSMFSFKNKKKRT